MRGCALVRQKSLHKMVTRLYSSLEKVFWVHRRFWHNLVMYQMSFFEGLLHFKSTLLADVGSIVIKIWFLPPFVPHKVWRIILEEPVTRATCLQFHVVISITMHRKRATRNAWIWEVEWVPWCERHGKHVKSHSHCKMPRNQISILRMMLEAGIGKSSMLSVFVKRSKIG